MDIGNHVKISKKYNTNSYFDIQLKFNLFYNILNVHILLK